MTKRREVSKRARCLVEMPIREVDRKRYVPGVWPWCFRPEPGCKSITIHRDCMTRSQHMNMLATPRGYTWKGLHDLSKIMDIGDQSGTRRDNTDEDESGVKIVTEALKLQNKSSFDKKFGKANFFPSYRNSNKGKTTALYKDVTSKIPMTTKPDQNFKKNILKTVNNGTPTQTFQKSARNKATKLKSPREIKDDNAKSKPDQNFKYNTIKTEQIDKIKILNGDSFSEINNKIATKTKQGQTIQKANTKIAVKTSKMQQKTANQLNPGQKTNEDKTNALNGKSLREIKTDNAKSKPDQSFKNNMTKTGIKVTALNTHYKTTNVKPKTHDQTSMTLKTKQMDKKSLRDNMRLYENYKEILARIKKRFIFEKLI